MRRSLLFAALAVLMAVPTLLAQPAGFFWDSHILYRTGEVTTPQGTFRDDTNRFDMTIPLRIGDLIVKGAGQIFAPRHFWRFYDPMYNGDGGGRDQAYIDQFKGVQRWLLDTVSLNLFHNSNNLNPASPGQVNFYKMTTDYKVPRNSDSALVFSRSVLDNSNLIEEATFVFDETALRRTIDDNGSVNRTDIALEQFGTDMEFGKDESIMIMYINDFAEPVSQPVGGPTDQREWQSFIGYLEFQTGDSISVFRNPLPRNMVHGMILRSEAGRDTITNAYNVINIGQLPYLTNFDVQWVGVVELDTTDLPDMISSVEYHFGTDAGEQGLNEVTPNPVRDEATIPFTLASIANVTLELYTADGRHVITLMKEKKYVEGKYSVQIDADDLESGSYIVRMTADDKAYSMKFVVTK